MSHVLEWNATIELFPRKLSEKTPLTLVGGIRENEHRPTRLCVRQNHTVNDEVLHPMPGSDQRRGALSGRDRQLATTRLVRRLAPAICYRNARRDQTTSAIRGQDVRSQFTACKNCISSPAVSGRYMIVKPIN